MRACVGARGEAGAGVWEGGGGVTWVVEACLTPLTPPPALMPAALGPALAPIESPYGASTGVGSAAASAELCGDGMWVDLVREWCMVPMSRNGSSHVLRVVNDGSSHGTGPQWRVLVLYTCL